MADGGEEAFDRQRAVSLLQEATRFLHQYSSSQTASSNPRETGDSQQSTSTSTTSMSTLNAARPSTSQESGEPRSTRVLHNFQALFAPYRSRPGPSTCSSVQISQPPVKKGKWSKSKTYFKRETWTHEFYCLADRSRVAPPSKAMQNTLQLAGLGRKKVCFNWKANAAEVKAQLEETYPKLCHGGGFDILRRGPSASELTLIRPPASGYSVPFLRDAAGLGQALAFIRPLQVNLNTDKVEETLEYGEFSSAPVVNCINCGIELPVTSVREHQMNYCVDEEMSDSECSVEKRIPDVHVFEISDVPRVVDPRGSSATVTHNSVSTVDDSLQDGPTASSNMNDRESLDSTGIIQQVIPGLPISTVQHALTEAKGDVNRAVNSLLSEKGGESDDIYSDSELLSSPFAISFSTLQELMKHHKESLGINGHERIQIRREKLWPESIAKFKNPRYNVLAVPTVTFEGEAGIDAGGLGREYACLLRKAIFSQEANLFEGVEDRKLLIYSIEGLQSRLFQLVGKMVSCLIVHFDVGAPCLSEAAYQYIISGSADVAADSCCIEDVADYELREVISKVNSVETEDELSEISNTYSVTDALLAAGWLHPFSLKNCGLAMQTVMLHDVLLKRKEPLDQLCKGLSTLGILDLMRAHPDLMKPYFVHDAEPHLTSDDIINNLEIPEKDQSRDSYNFLIQAIKDLERDQGSSGLSSLLQFMTALDEIPPLGLPQQIFVEFSEGSQTTFFAETCTLVLRVPTVHSNFSDFQKKIAGSFTEPYRICLYLKVPTILVIKFEMTAMKLLFA